MRRPRVLALDVGLRIDRELDARDLPERHDGVVRRELLPHVRPAPLDLLPDVGSRLDRRHHPPRDLDRAHEVRRQSRRHGLVTGLASGHLRELVHSPRA